MTVSPYAGQFRDDLEDFVAGKYFGRGREDISELQRASISPHIESRYATFGKILPWLKRHCEISDSVVVEIGSGSGASTHAILSEVKHVHCFDIDSKAVDIAEFRLERCGHTNYTLNRRLFDKGVADEMGQIDGLFLAAVLEHTTLDECTTILRDAWAVLRPGGWICVADTPNRFCGFDHHTALLPFYSMLPAEVRIAYSKFSPRPDFASVFDNLDYNRAEVREHLARWGAGISYHEFEIALGQDVHSYIIADGFEKEIVDMIGITSEDTLTMHMLSLFAAHVNRAFARRGLHMILQKPRS